MKLLLAAFLSLSAAAHAVLSVSPGVPSANYFMRSARNSTNSNNLIDYFAPLPGSVQSVDVWNGSTGWVSVGVAGDVQVSGGNFNLSSTLTATINGKADAADLADYVLTADLTTALSGKLDVPAGTTSQYVRGNGTLATFPTLVSSFTNDSGYITSSALSGYVTTAALSAALADYLTTAAAASTYATQSSLTSGLAAKEGTISAGTTAQYWRGDKTWQAFPTDLSSFANGPGFITSSALSPYLTTTSAAATYSPLGHTHTFASLTSKPTTLSGYGITDAYPLSGNPSGFLTAEVDGSTTNEIELPTQTGQSGKVLSTNGTSPSWITPAAGTVTSVSGTAPISVATGTTTPVVSIAAASTSAAGSMSAADKTKLDTIAEEQRTIVTTSGGTGRVTWTFPVAYGGGVVPVIQANAVKPTASTTVSYNCAIYGDPTNTSVTIEVTAINNNITGILALIGVGTPAPNGTKVHIVAKAP